MNGTNQSLIYADVVNILGGSLHTIQKNAAALIVTSKEIGLELNADKTNNLVMSRDQNAGRNHSMKTDNISFEMIEEFKYLETTLKNQNHIQVDFKSRLNSDILAIIRCRMFCLLVCLLFCLCVKHGR
jgi:hypothetical protein